MTATLDWVGRLPRETDLGDARTQEKATSLLRPMLASVAWMVQAALLAILAYFLLSDAAGGLVDVIAGPAALWQVALSIIALVVPFVAAVTVTRLLRADGGSLALTLASAAAVVLCTGLAEMGGFALFLLAAGA